MLKVITGIGGLCKRLGHTPGLFFLTSKHHYRVCYMG